jgi:hypothetical protein
MFRRRRLPTVRPSLPIDQGRPSTGLATDCTHGITPVRFPNHTPLACKRSRSEVSARLTARPASSV